VSQLATLSTLVMLVASSAWAQTTAPAPGGSTGAPATGSGIGDYWWLILIVVIAAIALWYFMRRNRPGV
jgi:LPXTG-motif cell wall-anchored protein